MSTITVTNIKATGETASRSVTGVSAAWGCYDVDGAVTARDSLNVSGYVDNGVGDISISFTSNFANSNYSAVFGSLAIISNLIHIYGLKDGGTYGTNDGADTKGVGSARTYIYTSGLTTYDLHDNSFSFDGDLA